MHHTDLTQDISNMFGHLRHGKNHVYLKILFHGQTKTLRWMGRINGKWL